MSLKSDQNNRYFTRRPMQIYETSRSTLHRMRNALYSFLEKIKTRILCSITSYPENSAVWDNVGNWGTAGQTTDVNKIRVMCIACWILKATDTVSEYILLITFRGENGYAKLTQCYVYTYIACLADRCLHSRKMPISMTFPDNKFSEGQSVLTRICRPSSVWE